ncbi:MAG: hypothetical protein EOP06_00715 [Proteobacteria bacterium]|nr:MAG: hypothetical protein EOP06_00715 [Pseudomonadota bacterium]
MDVKAPGLPWFAAIFTYLGDSTGRMEASLLLAIVLIQFLTLITIDSILEALKQKTSTRILSILFLAGSSHFIGLSHEFFVEPLQALAVALFFLLALKTHRLHFIDGLLSLLLLIAFAMISKATSPIYCAFPGIVILWELYQKFEFRLPNRWLTLRRGIILLCGSLFFGFTCAWYWTNRLSLLEFMRNASDGHIAEMYGKKLSFLPKFAYWVHQTQIAYLPVSVAVALAPALAKLRVRKIMKVRLREFSLQDAVVAVAFCQIIVCLALFGTQINEETRYLFPLSACFTMVFARIVDRFSRIGVAIAVAGLLITMTANQMQAFGVVERSGSRSNWLNPVHPSSSQRDVIMRVVVRTCLPEANDKITYVAIDTIDYNANSMAFLKQISPQLRDINCRYSSLGWAETDPDAAKTRLLQSNAIFYVAPEVIRSDDIDKFNVVATSIFQFIKTSQFYRFEPALVARGSLIYRHVIPDSTPFNGK